ncbi:hypothetical protein PC122_g8649 [Phytophthora cactorum]|nr:hypothetical protein PC122_g8649 [Phytophthora cactorum]
MAESGRDHTKERAKGGMWGGEDAEETCVSKDMLLTMFEL